MIEPRWQARIDIPGTRRRGSGFLVTDRHVFTCAHVVHGHDEAAVTLRDAPDPRPATVVADGPWWSPTAAEADVAVLELHDPVAVEPAVFAPHTGVEIYALQPLATSGYPRGYEPTGVSTGCTVSPYRLIGPNVQLDAQDDLGVWLQEGFSGAAVYHEGTGQVLGMVKAAGRGAERVGVMVPVTQLARHCPRLDDLIELGSLSAKAYTELRDALRTLRLPPVEVGRILTSVRAKIEGMPHHLTSLAAVVEAMVVETMLVDDAEMRWHLAGLMSRLDTDETRRWASLHLWPGALPEVKAEPTHDGAVVVRLEPAAASGAEAYDLTVWTVTGADGELSEPVVSEPGLTRGQWQDRVEDGLCRALGRMPMTVSAVVVEFVLPRRFLSEPVDEWFNRADDDTPLGVSRPVVVRDLDWFNHANPADLTNRVRRLRDTATSLGDRMRWRDCRKAPGSPIAFKAWLRTGDGPLALGLTGQWAQPEHLSSAVASGPPVMVWRREPCAPGTHESGTECAGLRFSRDLTEALRGVTIDAVAQRVRELRADAAAEEDEMHCGSGITLLRDDGLRRPMPLSFAE
jgi:hypothetical protein